MICMMKLYYLLFAGMLLHTYLFAQSDVTSISDYNKLKSNQTFKKDTTLNYLNTDSTWWSGVQIGLNFNQSSFSKNWTGGGLSSYAFTSLFTYELHYNTDALSWDNQVEGLYGIIKNADQTYLRKSQDRVYLDTKLGYQVSEDWNAYVSVNFLTQFAPGYRYEDDAVGNEIRFLISDFMAPGFLTASLGIEYRPGDNFWLRISPFSPRLTFVTNTNLVTEDGRNYGVKPSETIRKEWLAFQVVTEYQKKLTDIIKLQVRYLLFSSYDSFTFNTIDHRLDLLFNASLTRFINVSTGVIALYDIDQDNKVQISQSLGIGILLQK